MNLLTEPWGLREPPLAPEAALGLGPAARALALRVLEDPEGLSGVVGHELILVTGSPLPWVDGVGWLGRDPLAPTLWVPTRAAPPVHPALVLAALGGAPTALWLDPPLRIPLAELRPIRHDILRAWLG